jgi:two-component system cell cycle sensor histidine kinase/response regulator CckA
MERMHSLLKRQIKRNLGNIDAVPKTWEAFIKDVSDAYHQIDLDRAMLERSLDLSSRELLQANSEMRAIIDAFPDLLFRTDREGIILDYQTSNTRDLHFLQGEVIGRFISNIFPGNVGKKFDEAIARVRETNSPVNIEYSLSSQDSEYCYEARLLTVLENQIIIIIRNITERKRAEEALRDSENRYRAIFENTGTATMIIEKDNIISLVNTELEKQSGYSRGEIEGRRWTDFIVKEDLNQLKEYYRLRGATSEAMPRKYEARLIDKGGRIRNAFITVSNLPGTDKRVASFLDLSEIRRMEEALSKSEERLRRITDNMMDLVIQIDVRGVIQYLTPSATRILGYGIDYGLGKSSLTFIHPDDRKNAENAFLDMIESGLDRVIEVRVQHHDGHYIWMELLGNVLDAGDGERSGAVVVCRNITDRKHMEEELRKSEEKYRTILETIEDGYFETDLAGNLVFFNPATCRALGYSADELIGLNYKKFMDAQTAGKVKQIYDYVNKTGNAMKSFDYELIRKDGTKLYVETSVSLMNDAKGNLIGFRGVGRDITENKKLETLFLQAQKMEAIGTLAGGIAHDFNNLLMGIQGHASLILFDLKPDHPYYTKLKHIENIVRSGAELTRQLLGFARRGKYEVQATNLNVILENTSSMFGRTKREITIHRKFQEDLWITEVDRGQIEQVLLNIYVNAWQSMPGGGEIFLETRNVVVDESYDKQYAVKPGKYVKMSIIDTGVGMDEKTRERIFEPFFTTKEMGRGTGLGLASVYGIIKGHGGFINVYSEKGLGTTFGIYLPISEKEVPAEKPPVREILKGNETILLVDDEDMIINVSREILEALGYNVIVAKNGEAAVEIYREKKDKIDLVILDMIMPGMGGAEVFDILRTINPRIKVILSSGYSVDGRPAKMLERGCSGFIQKPYMIGEISYKIREVLDTKTDFQTK